MSCTDFCTAAKCAELEARIASLESKYETLLDAFLTHKDGTVYDVHGFNPNIIVDVTEYEGTYYLSVILDTYYGNSTTFTVTPKPPEVEFFTVKTTTVGEWEFILTIDGVETRAILPIEFPPLELYFEQYYYGNEIEVYLYSNSEIYADTYAEIYLELNELTIEQEPEDPHVVSNLELVLTYANDILEITVADGESSATGTVFINAEIINNYDGGEGSSVSCEQKVEECCQQILAAIAEVKSELTIEVSGELITDYTHEFELDSNDDIIPTYAISQSQTKTYEHAGLAGIHELLKVILTNQEQLHLVGTEGISPPVTVDLASTVDGLCSMYDLQTQDDFNNEEEFLAYIRSLVEEQLSNSISKFLLKRVGIAGGLPGMAVATTVDWGIGFLLDKLTAQEQIANKSLCDAIANLELDTVCLVASESEVARIEGNVLTIHFVGLNDYPKRNSNQGIRPIHIPAPKASYDWATDFADIRWEQGNQYAKLKLEGYKQGITGWFKDADSANATFDKLLTLTTAVEKGRNIPNHTNPRTDIAERTSRPYRAFISREVEPGQPECLIKYYPPQDEAEN